MSADRWGDDQLFEEAAQLTRAQIALRDNEAPPPPNAGAARARRIEAIKAEIAQSALDEIDLLRASIDLAELRRLRRENTELKVRLMRGVIRRTRS